MSNLSFRLSNSVYLCVLVCVYTYVCVCDTLSLICVAIFGSWAKFNWKIKLKKTWAATETKSPLFLNIFLVYVFIYANILQKKKKTRKNRKHKRKYKQIITHDLANVTFSLGFFPVTLRCFCFCFELEFHLTRRTKYSIGFWFARYILYRFDIVYTLWAFRYI